MGVVSDVTTLKVEVAVPPAGGWGAGGLNIYVVPDGSPVTLRVTGDENAPYDLTVIV